MAIFQFISLVFLTFTLMCVQTAPRDFVGNAKIKSNSIFFDDNNKISLTASNYIENQRSLLSQRLNPKSLLQDKKLSESTYITDPDTGSTNDGVKQFKTFPYLDDLRQNWGILINGTSQNENDDEEQFRRPINIPMPSTNNPSKSTIDTAFKEPRAKPLLAAEIPSPALLVGENLNFPISSEFNEKTKVKPTSCDIALIVCCMSDSNLEKCFAENGCPKKVLQTKSKNCQKSELHETLKQMNTYLFK